MLNGVDNTYKVPLPEPLVPADHDVSMLSDFRLHVDRLLASELVAIGTPEECWAALMLWCRAWKQTPGGSLPNDERSLAGFSGAGRRWKKIREVALHGFVLCSDGRLYHPVLCEEVKRAYASHIASVQRKEADRKRITEWRLNRGRNALRTPNVAEGTEPYTDTGTEPDHSSLRSEEDSASLRSAGVARAPPISPDPIKSVWDKGLSILGPGQRSLLGKLRKSHGDATVLAAIVDCEAENPSNPPAFLIACCDRRHDNEKRLSPVDALYLGAARAADAHDQRKREAARCADCEAAQPLLDRC